MRLRLRRLPLPLLSYIASSVAQLHDGTLSWADGAFQWLQLNWHFFGFDWSDFLGLDAGGVEQVLNDDVATAHEVMRATAFAATCTRPKDGHVSDCSLLPERTHLPPVPLTPSQLAETLGKTATMLSVDPPITRIEDVLTTDAAALLLDYATETLRSGDDPRWRNLSNDRMYEASSCRDGRCEAHRNNMVMLLEHEGGNRAEKSCGNDRVQAALEDLVQFFCALTRLPAQHVEQLRLGVYSAGQWFRPHQDFAADFDDFLAPCGPRLWSLIVYLNDEYEGGQTVFRALGNLSTVPRVGMGVLWPNAYSGTALRDLRTVHEGASVRAGTKYVIVLHGCMRKCATRGTDGTPPSEVLRVQRFLARLRRKPSRPTLKTLTAESARSVRRALLFGEPTNSLRRSE
jgi:hypothetical protein